MRASLTKEIDKEKELIKNLFVYIRGKTPKDEVIANEAGIAQRMCRDSKEKA
jgi:hypothetical protein